MKNTLKSFFLLGIVVSSLFIANSVLAIEYGGIGGRPAYPRSSEPRSESIYIHSVNGGDEINEGIKVINNTGERKTLMIYSADYSPSTDGGFACKQFLETKSEVGSWIEIPVEEITLEANSNEVVDFLIKVPEDVSPGEHNGCVLVQERKVSTNDAGINLALRTGMRVLLTVEGEIIRALRFLSFEVRKNDNGNYYLTPEVINEGNVSLDSNVKVYVYNPFNKMVKEYGGLYSVLKGETSRWNFEFIRPFWGGYYKAYSQITYNDGVEKVVESSPRWFLVIPTNKALMIIGLILLPFSILLIWSILKKARLSRKRRNWVNYKVTTGDDVMMIADKFSIDWKELVRVNNIKEPYKVKVDEIILVPRKGHDKEVAAN